MSHLADDTLYNLKKNKIAYPDISSSNSEVSGYFAHINNTIKQTKKKAKQYKHQTNLILLTGDNEMTNTVLESAAIVCKQKKKIALDYRNKRVTHRSTYSQAPPAV